MVYTSWQGVYDFIEYIILILGANKDMVYYKHTCIIYNM